MYNSYLIIAINIIIIYVTFVILYHRCYIFTTTITFRVIAIYQYVGFASRTFELIALKLSGKRNVSN